MLYPVYPICNFCRKNIEVWFSLTNTYFQMSPTTGHYNFEFGWLQIQLLLIYVIYSLNSL